MLVLARLWLRVDSLSGAGCISTTQVQLHLRDINRANAFKSISHSSTFCGVLETAEAVNSPLTQHIVMCNELMK